MDESERLITAKLLTWSEGRKVSFPDSDFLLIYNIPAKNRVFGSQLLIEPPHHIVRCVKRPSQSDSKVGRAEGVDVAKIRHGVESLLYFLAHRIYCGSRNSTVCIDLAS